MSEERSKPVWPWIVGLLAALPALYTASFGPACWLTDRGVIPIELAEAAYYPLAVGMANWCSTSSCDAMTEFGMWGSNSESGMALMILIERIEILRRENRTQSADSDA